MEAPTVIISYSSTANYCTFQQLRSNSQVQLREKEMNCAEGNGLIIEGIVSVSQREEAAALNKEEQSANERSRLMKQKLLVTCCFKHNGAP